MQKSLRIPNALTSRAEEAIDQVRMRAQRLGLASAAVSLASATNVRDIISTMDRESFDVVVIDSIQTMYLDNLDSAPGTVAQVRCLPRRN